jgi:hypothetical protein
MRPAETINDELTKKSRRFIQTSKDPAPSLAILADLDLSSLHYRVTQARHLLVKLETNTIILLSKNPITFFEFYPTGACVPRRET